MGYKTDWGSSKNGCKVGFYYNDTLEYSADGSQARIHDWDIKFYSADPIWDTSNDLSVSGGAITNNSWNNPFNKSSSWSGTMTLKTASGEWQTLDYGSSHTATASESLSGISYAGGTLTNSVTITYPARAYQLPAAGATPTISSATSNSVTLYWSFPSATDSSGAAPVDSAMLQCSVDGVNWWNVVSLAQGLGYNTWYTHTGLAPSSQYYYRTQGYNSSGYGAVSGTSAGVWVTPGKPTIGTAVRNSDNSHTINWTNTASGRSTANVNNLYYTVDGVGWNYIGAVGATATSYTWTGPSANHYYTYLVQATNVVGSYNSDSSNTILNTITAPSISAGAPTVTAHGSAYDTIKNESSVLVSWSHSSFVQTWDVWLNGTKIYANLATGSVDVGGLDAGTTNSIYVKANRTIAPTGVSLPSATINVTALNTAAAPATVTLGAFTASGGRVSSTLSWTAVSGAAGYYVAKLSGGAVTGVGAVVGTSVALSNMDPNTTYQFAVYTLNAVGYSAGTASQAGTITPTTPDAPPAVDASYSAGTLFMSWTAPVDNGGSPVSSYQYKIERQELANGPWILDTDWTSVGNVIAYSLDKPTYISYKVSVRAVNGVGAGTEGFAETGIIGGYVRVRNASGGWDDVFIKINVAGAFSKTAIVRIFNGTDWVPLTYS